MVAQHKRPALAPAPRHPAVGLQIQRASARCPQIAWKALASVAGDAKGARDWLEGKVAKILYANEVSGFTVLLLSVSRSSTPSLDRPGRWEKVIGTFLKLRKGEPMKIYGTWEHQTKYGRAFKVTEWDVDQAEAPPGDAAGLQRYIAAAVTGAGAEIAGRLVGRLGEAGLRRALDEGDAAALMRPGRDGTGADGVGRGQVPGIGERRAAAILEGWRAGQGGRELLLFLLGLGLGPNGAARVQRACERKKLAPRTAIAQIRQNPYRLAEEVRGVGFKAADKIARALGVPLSSPHRYRAAIKHALWKAEETGGHCHLPLPRLVAAAEEVLHAEKEEEDDEEDGGEEAGAEEEGGAAAPFFPDEDSIRREVLELEAAGDLVLENVAGPGEAEDVRVHLRPTFLTERAVAVRLAELQRSFDASSSSSSAWPPERVEAWLEGYERDGAGPLSDEQRDAVRRAAREGVLLLTGGPGCGKTYTTRAVVALWRDMGLSVAAAAPTGRAALRLSEVCAGGATTLHRLLEFGGGDDDAPVPAGGEDGAGGASRFEQSPKKQADAASSKYAGQGGRGGFRRNEARPLSADAIVVDESSMVDLFLANALLRACAAGTRLLLVGDVDQLPSVGPGRVFGELCDSRLLPVVRLSKIFRQAERSRIVTNAHRINRGEAPRMEELPEDVSRGLPSDCVAFPAEEAEAILERLRRFAAEAAGALGFHPRRDLQVLAPMKAGRLGVRSLNALLQEALNPPRPDLPEIRLGGGAAAEAAVAPRGQAAAGARTVFRVGDRVIQTVNNYEAGKRVFNGEVGVVDRIERIAPRRRAWPEAARTLLPGEALLLSSRLDDLTSGPPDFLCRVVGPAADHGVRGAAPQRPASLIEAGRGGARHREALVVRFLYPVHLPLPAPAQSWAPNAHRTRARFSPRPRPRSRFPCLSDDARGDARAQACAKRFGWPPRPVEREVLYFRDAGDLAELQLAWAISIHKSQGSEYPAVALVLHPSHYVMLNRNLFYTALTRARELALVLGPYRAQQIAIATVTTKKRATLLAGRLAAALAGSDVSYPRPLSLERAAPMPAPRPTDPPATLPILPANPVSITCMQDIGVDDHEYDDWDPDWEPSSLQIASAVNSEAAAAVTAASAAAAAAAAASFAGTCTVRIRVAGRGPDDETGPTIEEEEGELEGEEEDACADAHSEANVNGAGGAPPADASARPRAGGRKDGRRSAAARGKGQDRKAEPASTKGRRFCLDERGAPLPRNLFYAKRRYYVKLKWRGENFSYNLQCGLEEATRERDRLVIACYGPAEAGARLVHPLAQYASERFYKEMFDSADPPKVGLHDREPGALAARRRLVAYLRRVGAFEGRPEPYEDERLEERTEAPAAPAGAGEEESEGEGAEGWPRGPLPQWAVAPGGLDHLDLEWGAAPFRVVLGAGTDAQAFLQWRDRALLALHGPGAAAGHGLSFPVEDYAHELFFRALFGPGGSPPVEVGPRDPQPGTRAARRRLRAFLRSCGALPCPPGVSACTAGPDAAAKAGAPALPPNVHRVRNSWRLGPGKRRIEISFLWGDLQQQVRVGVREGVEDAESLARARDRVALALFGPAAAVRPGAGLCRPLEEYAGELFYGELFEEGDAPRVGVHDPEPGSPEARLRLVRWLSDRCSSIAPPPWNNRIGPPNTISSWRGRAGELRPVVHTGNEADAQEDRPLGDGVPLPPNVFLRPGTPVGAPQRFQLRFLKENFSFDYTLPAGVRLFAARRIRDSILITLAGPDEAVRRGLCNGLAEYQAEPFYTALFGQEEPPRVGVRDPDLKTTDGRKRLRAFLALSGIIEGRGRKTGRMPKAVASSGSYSRGDGRGPSSEDSEGEWSAADGGAPSSQQDAAGPSSGPRGNVDSSPKGRPRPGDQGGEEAPPQRQPRRRRRVRKKGKQAEAALPPEADDAVPENVPLEELEPEGAQAQLQLALPPNIKRLSDRGRFEVCFAVDGATYKFTLPVGMRLFAARRVRDSILIALLGPEEAALRGLCYRLEEYHVEPFYQALFGTGGPEAEGGRPAVGVLDPELSSRDGKNRLRTFLVRCGIDIEVHHGLRRALALSAAPQNDGPSSEKGEGPHHRPQEAGPPRRQYGGPRGPRLADDGTLRHRFGGRLKQVGPARPPEPDDEVPENAPLETGGPLPPDVIVRGDPPRFGIRFRWHREEHYFWLPAGVRLFAARRARDATLLAMMGPREAALRGLCYQLEAYQEEPFYRALFGGAEGERPRVGVHDRAPRDREWRGRVTAFLAGFGLALDPEPPGRHRAGRKRKRKAKSSASDGLDKGDQGTGLSSGEGEGQPAVAASPFSALYS
eukprot:tig00020943_g16308.t1